MLTALLVLLACLILGVACAAALALLVVTLVRPDKGAGLLEIRRVEGIPVLWENGMPYFGWMTHTDHEQLDLAGTWKFRLDPGDDGYDQQWFRADLDDSTWHDHPVPGTWNTEKPEWLAYIGAGWYRRKFVMPVSMEGRFNRLTLDGVAFAGQVFLNGTLVGGHSGGYTQWSLDVTGPALCGRENTLAIRVDTRRSYDTLPPLTGPGYPLNWWSYGGIKRVIKITSGPPVTLCKLAVDTSHDGQIAGSAVLYNHKPSPAEAEVDICLLDLSGTLVRHIRTCRASIAGGQLAAVKFAEVIPGVAPWSPDTPENRYLLEIALATGDGREKQSTEIGFRRFTFHGTTAHLNGRSLYLRGVNRHEDDRRHGPVQNQAVIDRDLALLRDLHVNFLRPGHYPNDPAWLTACDRAGIMIAHEIPLYQLGTSLQSLCATLGKTICREAARHLIEMIERDRNHPCVVMWSVGNENVPFLPSVRRILKQLCTLSREFDPARLVTFATMHIPYGVLPRLDFCSGLADVLFINEYCGWYSGRPEDVGCYLDAFHRRWPEKPIVVSEFGAGAVKGRAAGSPVRVGPGAKRDFTEEYQERFHEVQLKHILDRPFVAGTMPWVFADFRDDKRPKNPIPNMNLKGLVSYDREPKKAYAVFQRAYARIKKEPG